MITFANPAFLWALALALAPLLIHLWRRPAEPPAIDFAATRLLAAAAHRVARRVQVREWLLLIARTLLLVVIVLAFARPGAHRPGSRITGPGSASRLTVGIVADAREYLAAALGPTSPRGESRLIFLDEKSALPDDQDWVRLDGIRTATRSLGGTPSPASVPHRSPPSRADRGDAVPPTTQTDRLGPVTVAAGPYYHPALAVFDQAGHGDLRRVRVWRWWKLEPRGAAIVIARLSNGDPFLVEHWDTTGKTIVCAVPADVTWSDLPLHPNFVPLLDGLVRYLEQPPPRAGEGPRPADAAYGAPRAAEIGRWLFGAGLVLVVVEMIISVAAWEKLAAGAVLLLLLLHPTFAWHRLRPRPAPLVIIADRTDSMQFRADALAALLGKMPRGDTVMLTGHQTPLGGALLALTNRALAAVVLLSDGQHNDGVSPAWAAAALGRPVFTVAVGEPGSPRDVAITALDATDLVFGGERAVVRATIAATGDDNPRLTVKITLDSETLLVTNVTSSEFHAERPPESRVALSLGGTAFLHQTQDRLSRSASGIVPETADREDAVPPNNRADEARDLPPHDRRLAANSQARNDKVFNLSLRFTPPRSGVYVLRLAPLPGEATTANNRRPFAMTVVPGKIRVRLDHQAADWEFRHVRHALERDPAVTLVAGAEPADVVMAATGQTWRLEALGGGVFQQYWSDRVRAEFEWVRHPARVAAPPVAEELSALGRNDALLAEVARVSGGGFFTAATTDRLAAAVAAHRRGEPHRFDLRDSWLALLAVAAGLIISWARRRLFSGTA